MANQYSLLFMLWVLISCRSATVEAPPPLRDPTEVGAVNLLHEHEENPPKRVCYDYSDLPFHHSLSSDTPLFEWEPQNHLPVMLDPFSYNNDHDLDSTMPFEELWNFESILQNLLAEAETNSGESAVISQAAVHQSQENSDSNQDTLGDILLNVNDVVSTGIPSKNENSKAPTAFNDQLLKGTRKSVVKLLPDDLIEKEFSFIPMSVDSSLKFPKESIGKRKGISGAVCQSQENLDSNQDVAGQILLKKNCVVPTGIQFKIGNSDVPTTACNDHLLKRTRKSVETPLSDDLIESDFSSSSTGLETSLSFPKSDFHSPTEHKEASKRNQKSVGSQSNNQIFHNMMEHEKFDNFKHSFQNFLSHENPSNMGDTENVNSSKLCPTHGPVPQKMNLENQMVSQSKKRKTAKVKKVKNENNELEISVHAELPILSEPNKLTLTCIEKVKFSSNSLESNEDPKVYISRFEQKLRSNQISMFLKSQKNSGEKAISLTNWLSQLNNSWESSCVAFTNLVERSLYLINLISSNLKLLQRNPLPSHDDYFEWLIHKIFDSPNVLEIFMKSDNKNVKLSPIEQRVRNYMHLKKRDQNTWKELMYMVGIWYKNNYPQLWKVMVGENDQVFWYYMKSRIMNAERARDKISKKN